MVLKRVQKRKLQMYVMVRLRSVCDIRRDAERDGSAAAVRGVWYKEWSVRC